jgi:hypothetical protein
MSYAFHTGHYAYSLADADATIFITPMLALAFTP